MQQLDDDMDELFRRAAENYPLKEVKNQWKDIESRLMTAQASPDNKKNNREYRKFLFPFLLLICLVIGIIFFTMIYNGKGKRNNNIIPSKVSASTIQKVQNTERTMAAAKAMTKNNPQQNFLRNHPKNHTQQNPAISIAISANNKSYANSKSDPNDPSDNAISSKKNDTTLTEFIKDKIPFTPGLKADLTISPLTPRLQYSIFKKPDPVQGRKKTTSGFSLSVVAGTELSRVSEMPFRAGGFNAGLFGGYDISPKFFLEAGILAGRKLYLSSGHDFSLKKIGDNMPGGMVINDLEGLSNILEFPLHGAFRIKKFNEGNIYISGGISAYLVTKENNHYNVTMNGASEKMEGTYKKNIFLLPATVNISAGAEKKLSPVLSLRGEIYFRHPVKGIGVGELPVTSVGLQLGLKKRFR